ncbi:MAG: flagellar hook-length control protein FliK [Pseudomonadota bacterium]
MDVSATLSAPVRASEFSGSEKSRDLFSSEPNKSRLFETEYSDNKANDSAGDRSNDVGAENTERPERLDSNDNNAAPESRSRRTTDAERSDEDGDLTLGSDSQFGAQQTPVTTQPQLVVETALNADSVPTTISTVETLATDDSIPDLVNGDQIELALNNPLDTETVTSPENFDINEPLTQLPTENTDVEEAITAISASTAEQPVILGEESNGLATEALPSASTRVANTLQDQLNPALQPTVKNALQVDTGTDSPDTALLAETELAPTETLDADPEATLSTQLENNSTTEPAIEGLEFSTIDRDIDLASASTNGTDSIEIEGLSSLSSTTRNGEGVATPVTQASVTRSAAMAANAAAQIATTISINSKQDEISIQLDPPELGALQIKLSFGEGGSLQAQLSFENDATRDLMRDRSDELKAALEDAGFSDTQLDFGSQGGFAESSSENNKDDEQQLALLPGLTSVADRIRLTSPVASNSPDAGIDVRV